jgi:hypothetical protein
MTLLDAATLGRLAGTEVDVSPSIGDVQATYHGTQIPLHGIARITSTRHGVSAEIDDVERWEHEARKLLPSGSPLPASLFRISYAGNLITAEGKGSIVPDGGGWKANDAINSGQHSEFGANSRNLSTFKFYVGNLEIHGPSYGARIAATREIYAGGEWNHATEFRDRRVVVRALSRDAAGFEDETLAITVDGELGRLNSEALWLWASLISGNRLGALLTEYYDEGGLLIAQVHRRGSPGIGRWQFFRPFYAPFSAEGAQAMLDGIAQLLEGDFPIEVVFDHLFQAVRLSTDAQAIHLVLAYHAAIEAWNRKHGRENWMDDKPWSKQARRIRKEFVPTEFYDEIGENLTANLKPILAHANRTTTAWRQANLFEALGIDVSGDDARRILKMRDELLHNGYFLKRWDELSEEERQHRYDDVERLRRLVLFVIFRLTGYVGQFQDPVTFELMQIAPQNEGPVAP